MPEQKQPQEEELRRILRERGDRMPADIVRLVRAVVNEPDGEISHDECRETLAQCVDTALAGGRIAEQFPAVKRHLDMCDECAKEYADLMDLTQKELGGQIPMPEDIPAPDLSFLPGAKPLPALQPAVDWVSVWEFAKQKAAKVLAAVAPALTVSFDQIAQDFYRQVQLNGLQSALQPITRDQSSSRVNEALTTIAVAYAATNAIIDSFTPEQIDSLAAQNLLCAKVEERAKIAALEIHAERSLGWKIAEQFAAQVCQDPANLRALVQKHKQ